MINSDYEGKGRLALGHSEWRSLDNFSARTFSFLNYRRTRKLGTFGNVAQHLLTTPKIFPPIGMQR